MRRSGISKGMLIALLVITTGGFVAFGTAAVTPRPAFAYDASGTTKTATSVGAFGGYAQFGLSTGADRVAALSGANGPHLTSAQYLTNAEGYVGNVASNFGFDIPPAATNVAVEFGIIWRVTRCHSYLWIGDQWPPCSTGEGGSDNFSRLSISATFDGSAPTNSTPRLVQRHTSGNGAPSTTWFSATGTKTGLTPASVSNANLRVGILAYCKSAGLPTWCDTGVDALTAKVTYTMPNTAPVISDFVNSCGTTYERGKPCAVSFTTTDPDGLGVSGDTVIVWCAVHVLAPGDSNYCEDPLMGQYGVKIEIQPNGADGHTLVDAGNGTWTFTDLTRTGRWDAPVQQWSFVVTPGAEADLSADGATWTDYLLVVDSVSGWAQVQRSVTMLAANALPTALNYADSCGGTWIPGEECTFSFRTFDPDTNGLGDQTNSYVALCFFESSDPDPQAMETECAGTSDNFDGRESALFLLKMTTATTEDVWTPVDIDAGTNQSWDLTGYTRSAPWTSNTIDWTLNVRIGAIAAASSDWQVGVWVLDDVGGWSYVVDPGNTVATSTAVTSAAALDFGPLSPGTDSAAKLRDVSLRCNQPCNLELSTSDWQPAVGARPISPNPTMLAPLGVDEFALLCRLTNSPAYDPGVSVFDEDDAVRIGPSWVSLGPVPHPGVGVPAPMTLESQGDVQLECGLKNGNTQPGVYSGTVTFRAVGF